MGGAVALGSGGTFVRARLAEAQVSLKPFVDALPIPTTITPDGRSAMPVGSRIRFVGSTHSFRRSVSAAALRKH